MVLESNRSLWLHKCVFQLVSHDRTYLWWKISFFGSKQPSILLVLLLLLLLLLFNVCKDLQDTKDQIYQPLFSRLYEKKPLRLIVCTKIYRYLIYALFIVFHWVFDCSFLFIFMRKKKKLFSLGCEQKEMHFSIVDKTLSLIRKKKE